MRGIGSVYAGDGPKPMGGYRGHGLRGTDPGGRDRPSIQYPQAEGWGQMTTHTLKVPTRYADATMDGTETFEILEDR